MQRLKILTEEWMPDFPNKDYFIVFPNNSIFHASATRTYPGDVWGQKWYGCVFAPDEELAKTIVQIRQGKYRPTKEDIRITFYTICKKECPKNISEGTEDIMGYAEFQTIKEQHYYFFTSSQRATFIASIEKVKGETAEQVSSYLDKFFDEKNLQIGGFEKGDIVEGSAGRIVSVKRGLKTFFIVI